MKITTIGIDLAKNVLQIHGANDRGKPVVPFEALDVSHVQIAEPKAPVPLVVG